MNRRAHWIISSSLAAGLCACSGPAVPPPPPAPVASSAPERLTGIVERYWDERARLTGVEPQALADSLALERRYLSMVDGFPAAALDAQAGRTLEMFRRERRAAILGFTYPSELLPLNPYVGVAQEFAATAIEAESRAGSSAQDVDAWRIDAQRFAAWTQQAIANMRDGMRRGYTQPRPVVDRTLRELQVLATDTPANPFYVGATAGATPSAAMRAVIATQVLPSYRALHDFLQHEYLGRARSSVALSALPLGAQWYAFLANRSTGGDATAAELHALGVAELERLHQRMQALLNEAAFPGNAAAFVEHMRHDPRFAYASAADLSSAYLDLQPRVDAAAAMLFSHKPPTDLRFRSVAAYLDEQAAPLTYRPSPADGGSPGILYVNASLLAATPAVDAVSLYLREAVPGHDYQDAIQRERKDLPRFRRFGATPAFVAGWGLYAASLGDELGLYPVAEARFGALLAQTACAAGLVIDTGLHADGWSRQQALEYLQTAIPIDAAGAERMVDRVIAVPAEALACTVGFLKLQSLRKQAERALGDRFDVKAFHAQILEEGSMPLDLLETKIKTWIDDVVSQDRAARLGATGVSATPAGADAAPLGESMAPAGAGAASAGTSAAPAGVTAAPTGAGATPAGGGVPPR